MTLHIPRTGPTDLRELLEEPDEILERIAYTRTHDVARLAVIGEHLHKAVGFADRNGGRIGGYLTQAQTIEDHVDRWAALQAVFLVTTAPHLQVVLLPLRASRDLGDSRAPLPVVLLPVLRLCAQRGTQRTRSLGLIEAGAGVAEAVTMDWDAVLPGWPVIANLPGSDRAAPRQGLVQTWAAGPLEWRPDRHGPILTNRAGGAASATGVSQALAAGANIAGMGQMHACPESVRGAVASMLAQEQGIEAAAAYYGIASIGLVQKRLQPRPLRSAVAHPRGIGQ